MIFAAAVNRDIKKEIEEIQSECYNMCYETENLVDKTNDRFSKTYAELNRQRKKIYKSTFKRAAEITDKIKLIKTKQLNNEIQLVEISRYVENLPEGNFISPVQDFLNFADNFLDLLRGPIGNFIRYVDLTNKRDEALAQREQLYAECEAAKLECTKIEKLNATMKDSKKVIKALNELTIQSENAVEEILEKKGTNSSKWSKHEIETVRTMFNLLKALSDIMNTEVITAKGNISRKYKKLISGATELIGENEE